MRRRFSPSVGLMAFVASAIGGCAEEGPELVDVTGVVTFNGDPARAEVIFEPISQTGEPGGRASSAWTAEDGSFRLGFTQSWFGAIPGPHRVRVDIRRKTADERTATFEEATAAVKSVRLLRTVSAAENRFDFPITW